MDSGGQFISVFFRATKLKFNKRVFANNLKKMGAKRSWTNFVCIITNLTFGLLTFVLLEFKLCLILFDGKTF